MKRRKKDRCPKCNHILTPTEVFGMGMMLLQHGIHKCKYCERKLNAKSNG